MRSCGSVSICGTEVKVYRALAKEVPDLDGHDGYYLYAERKIFIDANLDKDATLDTLVHEMAHAWFDLSGLRHWLQEATRLKGEAYDTFEEQFIRFQTPLIISSLKSARLLSRLSRSFCK